ncbi:ABC transporter permease [Oryzihumus sp.]|uniref:ABC transporter permease n=1 Tax=Oryzihumus sp. TaxID=1968903 RepID=UPI002EDA67EC
MSPTGRLRTPSAPGGLAALVLLAVLALVVLPLARLAQTVAQGGREALTAMARSPDLTATVGRTLLLAVLVTVVATPVGTAAALGLTHTTVPARRFWQVAMVLPVLLPPFVLGYSWTQAYGRAGLTDELLGLHWPALLGAPGVVVVLVVTAVPIVYVVTAAGLASGAEPDLARAARASGAGELTTLRTVTLPLLRPSIGAAAVLVFVVTLESFAVPQVMGTPASFTTVTTRIYSDLALGADPAAFTEAIALALLLVVLAAAVLAPADLVLAPRLRARRQGTAAAPDPPPPGSRTAGRVVAAALAGWLLLGLALPLLALLAASVTRAVGLPPTPANWTLDHFRSVTGPDTLAAVGRSLLLGCTAATVLTLLGGAVAVLERRHGGRPLATVVTLTLVLPGSTVAVALLITYGRWLGGTLALILLAYLAKLWAFAHRPLSGAVDRLPAQHVRAARAFGAGPLTAVRTVALRPLAPALLTAWVICLVTALHEVTMSSLLYGPGSTTVAVVVLNAEELGGIGDTAALSVLLTLLLLVPGLLVWLLVRHLRMPSAGLRTPADAVGVHRAW